MHPNSHLSRLRMAVFPDAGEPVRMRRFALELSLTVEEARDGLDTTHYPYT
jgi:hypothetical protein